MSKPQHQHRERFPFQTPNTVDPRARVIGGAPFPFVPPYKGFPVRFSWPNRAFRARAGGAETEAVSARSVPLAPISGVNAGLSAGWLLPRSYRYAPSRRENLSKGGCLMVVAEADLNQPAKPTPRPDVDPVAAGRAGGIASGEARRRKKQPRYWADVLREAVHNNPEAVVDNLLRSRNGAAIAKVFEIVRDLDRDDAEDLREVQAQAAELREEIASQLRFKENLAAELEEFEELSIERELELKELDQRHRELRAAIDADAEAAGMEAYEVSDDETAETAPLELEQAS